MAILAMHSAPKEDLALVDEALAGNQLAFQLIVERFQGRMFALVRHYTKNATEVEDVVQDTFLKAYTHLATFERQSSLYTWLARIAINTALDFLKRHGRNPVQAVEDLEVVQGNDRGRPSGHVPTPDSRIEREELAAITQRILEEIPEIFRTVLVLREFEDLSYQEMADVLGISIGTVESRLFRARARFRERLLRLYPEFEAGA